jgi:hypothetical protein
MQIYKYLSFSKRKHHLSICKERFQINEVDLISLDGLKFEQLIFLSKKSNFIFYF